MNIYPIIDIVRRAGDIIMQYYNDLEIISIQKLDNSPVTEADIAADQFIISSLKEIHPDIQVFSEETAFDYKGEKDFWLIDPLDATKSFIKKDGEFTINVALVKNFVPVLGIIYAPLSKVLYYSDKNKKAYKQLDGEGVKRIKVREVPSTGMTVLTSVYSNDQSKLELYLEDKLIEKIIPISSAIKICMIAEGSADLYPRFGKTMEWDTAAGHAILKAAGGNILDLEGRELIYGKYKEKFYNPEFIAYGANNL